MMTTALLRRYARVVIWISLSVIIIALVCIGRSLPLMRIIAPFHARLGDSGFWGPLMFGLFYVVATLLFIPVVVPTISAGVLFGVWAGTLIVSLASTASAALTFLTARYLSRVKVRRWLQKQPQLCAVDKALEHGGWKIVVLLRLSALLPFSLQNYLHGLTPIGFWPYLISTWLAMLPGIFLCVYIGQATEAAVSNTHDRIAAEWVALGVGVAATVAVSFYVTSLTKKQLQEHLVKEQVGTG
ncbi:MAG TPA: TVP38/TMEM64 family protein [Candidatus Binatia bacterium]|jgi:uncharacterized membrane protein YdjX (TVP38/TMEM64 family)|nr:TVP38/TMEM64 family protein [Candidatus Binatia bacterium]